MAEAIGIWKCCAALRQERTRRAQSTTVHTEFVLRAPRPYPIPINAVYVLYEYVNCRLFILYKSTVPYFELAGAA